MKQSAKRNVEDQYRKKLAAVLEKLATEQSTAGLKDQIEDLENYAKVLTISQSKWAPDFRLAVAVALVCISIAAFLWSKRVSHTSVSLSADTESIRASLDQNWHVERPFQSQLMHFERIGKVQAPNLGLSVENEGGDAWFRLDGGQIVLQSLDIESGAILNLSSDKDQTSLYVSLKPVRGVVTIVGKGTLSAGPNPHETTLTRPYSVEVPETIAFSTSELKVVPSRLTIHNADKWALGTIPIGELNFSKEKGRAITDTEITSGAKSGSIRFNDTTWQPLEISEDEFVSVNETNRAIVDVRSAGALVHVTVNGIVRSITLGRGEDQKRMAPTYLEYLYNKKTLAFFWGAIVFSWGVLWGIRKTIFR